MADRRTSISSDHEVQEYIASFRTSSDRVRWVLYLVVLTCVMLATLTWNTRASGWMMLRLDDFHDLARLKGEHDYLLERLGNQEREPTAVELRELARLRASLPAYETKAEYARQLIARMQIVSVPPLFGLSLDFNDVGPIGGTVLCLLMALLLVCFVRQHENLYLCAFKVRRLCENEDHADGESAANFLYHALVMTQVLNHPPTLARWQANPGLGRLTMSFARLALYFLPALVLMYVAITDLESVLVRGLPLGRIWLESTFVAILLIEATLVVIHVSACEHKWRQLFFDVNPHLLTEVQGRWTRWMDFRLASHVSPEEKHIAAKIEYARPVEELETESGVTTVVQTLPLPRDCRRFADGCYRLSEEAKGEMARYLFRAVRRQARGPRKADPADITYGQPEIKSVVANGRWTTTLTMSWTRRRRAALALEEEASRKVVAARLARARRVFVALRLRVVWPGLAE